MQKNLYLRPIVKIMAIEIQKVQSSADLRRFIRFANQLYADSPFYCPPLFIDELQTFNKKKNPSLEFCDFQCFLAYKNGEIVGRICALINPVANEHWNCKKVRFGWADFVDDLEVSKALFDAVKEWGKERGMEQMNGPVGFTDFDHQGLLLEGFEYVCPMASLYNYPYYQKHFETYGLTKEADWVEYLVKTPTEVPERLARISEISKTRYKLHVVKDMPRKEIIKRYGEQAINTIDTAYSVLYNYQPLTKKQKEYYVNMYFPLLNFDFCTFVVNEKDEVVGAGVGMPDITKALQKCQGKLFPFGWYHILKALKAKRFTHFNLLLIAVRPDYRNTGVDAIFFAEQIPMALKYGMQTTETTAILETNNSNRANWERFEYTIHKRRRAYIKDLNS